MPVPPYRALPSSSMVVEELSLGRLIILLNINRLLPVSKAPKTSIISNSSSSRVARLYHFSSTTWPFSRIMACPSAPTRRHRVPYQTQSPVYAIRTMSVIPVSRLVMPLRALGNLDHNISKTLGRASTPTPGTGYRKLQPSIFCSI